MDNKRESGSKVSNTMHVSSPVKVRLKVGMYRECQGNNAQCLECKFGGSWKGLNREGYVRVLQNNGLKSGLHFKAMLVAIDTQCLACERSSINVAE